MGRIEDIYCVPGFADASPPWCKAPEYNSITAGVYLLQRVYSNDDAHSEVRLCVNLTIMFRALVHFNRLHCHQDFYQIVAEATGFKQWTGETVRYLGSYWSWRRREYRAHAGDDHTGTPAHHLLTTLADTWQRMFQSRSTLENTNRVEPFLAAKKREWERLLQDVDYLLDPGVTHCRCTVSSDNHRPRTPSPHGRPRELFDRVPRARSRTPPRELISRKRSTSQTLCKGEEQDAGEHLRSTKRPRTLPSHNTTPPRTREPSPKDTSTHEAEKNDGNSASARTNTSRAKEIDRLIHEETQRQPAKSEPLFVPLDDTSASAIRKMLQTNEVLLEQLKAGMTTSSDVIQLKQNDAEHQSSIKSLQQSNEDVKLQIASLQTQMGNTEKAQSQLGASTFKSLEELTARLDTSTSTIRSGVVNEIRNHMNTQIYKRDQRIEALEKEVKGIAQAHEAEAASDTGAQDQNSTATSDLESAVADLAKRLAANEALSQEQAERIRQQDSAINEMHYKQSAEFGDMRGDISSVQLAVANYSSQQGLDDRLQGVLDMARIYHKREEFRSRAQMEASAQVIIQLEAAVHSLHKSKTA